MDHVQTDSLERSVDDALGRNVVSSLEGSSVEIMVDEATGVKGLVCLNDDLDRRLQDEDLDLGVECVLRCIMVEEASG